MIETAVVFDQNGKAIFWPGSKGATAGSIPDNSVLWDKLWDNREILGGVAHTHPGSGLPQPSYTDETTFAAIETGLGQRLYWPIVTMDKVAIFVFAEGSYYKHNVVFANPIHWEGVVKELRVLSRMGG